MPANSRWDLIRRLRVNIHVLLSSSRVVMSGLLLGIVLSVCNIRLPYFNELFLLILLHDHTMVPLIILYFFLHYYYYYYYYYHHHHHHRTKRPILHTPDTSHMFLQSVKPCRPICFRC